MSSPTLTSKLQYVREQRLRLEESKPLYPHILKRINTHIARLDKQIESLTNELTTANKGE